MPKFRWRQQSWQNSLNNHAKELEELLTIIDLYGLWKNRWPRNDATKILSNEIYTDAYMSIHLACYGLYKNAYMSLRSQFETALRLAYFSEHSLDLNFGSPVMRNGFNYSLKVPMFGDKSSNISFLSRNGGVLKIVFRKTTAHNRRWQTKNCS